MIAFHLSEFLYQFILFVFLFFVLKKILFSPLLEIFALRQSKTKDLVDKADALTQSIAVKNTQYRDTIHRARDAALTEKKKLIDEGAAAKADLLLSARERATQKINAAEKEIVERFNRIRPEIDTHANEIAQAIQHVLFDAQHRGNTQWIDFMSILWHVF